MRACVMSAHVNPRLHNYHLENKTSRKKNVRLWALYERRTLLCVKHAHPISFRYYCVLFSKSWAVRLYISVWPRPSELQRLTRAPDPT